MILFGEIGHSLQARCREEVAGANVSDERVFRADRAALGEAGGDVEYDAIGLVDRRLLIVEELSRHIGELSVDGNGQRGMQDLSAGRERLLDDEEHDVVPVLWLVFQTDVQPIGFPLQAVLDLDDGFAQFPPLSLPILCAIAPEVRVTYGDLVGEAQDGVLEGLLEQVPRDRLGRNGQGLRAAPSRRTKRRERIREVIIAQGTPVHRHVPIEGVGGQRRHAAALHQFLRARARGQLVLVQHVRILRLGHQPQKALAPRSGVFFVAGRVILAVIGAVPVVFPHNRTKGPQYDTVGQHTIFPERLRAERDDGAADRRLTAGAGFDHPGKDDVLAPHRHVGRRLRIPKQDDVSLHGLAAIRLRRQVAHQRRHLH